MGRRFVAGVLGFGLALVGATASMAAPAVAVVGSEAVTLGSVSEGIGQPRGVRPGVDALLVPDKVTAQKLVGASGRVESGNVDAYVATYSPESDAGYFAVTRDRGTSIAAARARLSTMSGSNSSAADTSLSPQTILVFSKFTRAQIEESLATLTTSIKSAKIAAAFYYEPENDSIRLSMRMAQVDSGFSIPITDVPIKLVDAEVKDTAYRSNMPAPFRGGGAIYDIRREPGRCTSGIPARLSSGTRGYFTAAHCYNLESHIWAAESLAGGSNTGRVTHDFGISTVDAAFVSGKTYSGQIYTGLNLSVSKPIVGSYFPTAGVGNRLCFSGSTTGVQCGNSLVTYSASTCVEGGGRCYSNVLALRGGVSGEPGDSGGPVYANFGDTVKVTGILHALDNPLIGQSTTYAMDWRRIASKYVASLILG